MIKLSLPAAPAFLTPAEQRRLALIYMADNSKRVWDKKEIKEALMCITHGKCAYSEVMLGEEGKYMEVEHIYPKSKYPAKVAEWGNLLPSLNFCNRKKGNVDPSKKPFVNPLVDDPKMFFFMKNARLVPMKGRNSAKAINTLELFGLNDPAQLRMPRFKVQTHIEANLENLRYRYSAQPGLVVERLKSVMRDCGRKSEYSATKSTVLLGNSDYRELKSLMISDSNWTLDFDALEKELEYCSLPEPRAV